MPRLQGRSDVSLGPKMQKVTFFELWGGGIRHRGVGGSNGSQLYGYVLAM